MLHPFQVPFSLHAVHRLICFALLKELGERAPVMALGKARQSPQLLDLKCDQEAPQGQTSMSMAGQWPCLACIV